MVTRKAIKTVITRARRIRPIFSQTASPTMKPLWPAPQAITLHQATVPLNMRMDLAMPEGRRPLVEPMAGRTIPEVRRSQATNRRPYEPMQLRLRWNRR
jgi:hypothetical protein